MMPPARPRSPFLEVNCTNVVNLAENVVNRIPREVKCMTALLTASGAPDGDKTASPWVEEKERISQSGMFFATVLSLIIRRFRCPAGVSA